MVEAVLEPVGLVAVVTPLGVRLVEILAACDERIAVFLCDAKEIRVLLLPKSLVAATLFIENVVEEVAADVIHSAKRENIWICYRKHACASPATRAPGYDDLILVNRIQFLHVEYSVNRSTKAQVDVLLVSCVVCADVDYSTTRHGINQGVWRLSAVCRAYPHEKRRRLLCIITLRHDHFEDHIGDVVCWRILVGLLEKMPLRVNDGQFPARVGLIKRNTELALAMRLSNVRQAHQRKDPNHRQEKYLTHYHHPYSCFFVGIFYNN